jgi:hypothetical protein
MPPQTFHASPSVSGTLSVQFCGPVSWRRTPCLSVLDTESLPGFDVAYREPGHECRDRETGPGALSDECDRVEQSSGVG